MSLPELKITRRKLPHWEHEGSAYFITFRATAGPLSAPERRIVVDHIRSGHGKFYDLTAVVVMPDHVHVLLQPNEGVGLGRVLKGIKGVSAHLLNGERSTHGAVWQDEYRDWIIRTPEDLTQKLRYMLYNPVKQGLVEDPWQYDGWYVRTE